MASQNTNDAPSNNDTAAYFALPHIPGYTSQLDGSAAFYIKTDFSHFTEVGTSPGPTHVVIAKSKKPQVPSCQANVNKNLE